MSNQISLRDVEKKIYQSTFQDGLIEISLAAFLLMFALAPLLSEDLGDFWSSFIFLPLWAVVALAVRFIRTRVILPRTGSVRFGQYRKNRLLGFSRVMLGFNLAALILGISTFFGFEGLAEWVIPSRFAALLLLGFSLAAAFLQQPRFYLYGVMVAAAPLIGEYLYRNYSAVHHGYPLSFGTSAFILFAVGLYMLLRLIFSHPVDPSPLPETEER
ncbi:MAG: hypothetical protein JXA25_14175 [Anaerolineales bacterium]|nr:hypothetical protein [Anaerolineales bacterium]